MNKILILTALLLISACSTRGRFVIPDDSQLYIYKRTQPVEINEEGLASMKPFGWAAAGGVPYSLLDENGNTISEGKLRARFRVKSLFFPPFAIFYWPMGLNGGITYDLINNTQE